MLDKAKNRNIDYYLRTLKKKGKKQRAEWSKNYLKSPYKFYGVTGDELKASVKTFYRENKNISKKELLEILDRLWNSDWHTEKTFSIKLASLNIKKFDSRDLGFFKKWLDQCTGWDHTDEICASIIGKLLLRYPKIKKHINSWTTSKHLWTRRASLLSYIQSVRKEKTYFPDLFSNIEKLMSEKEFFIRKAIGWILREATKKYPEDVKKFVKKNQSSLSSLSKREALRNIVKSA